jgi:hypothetical protein
LIVEHVTAGGIAILTSHQTIPVQAGIVGKVLKVGA